MNGCLSSSTFLLPLPSFGYYPHSFCGYWCAVFGFVLFCGPGVLGVSVFCLEWLRSMFTFLRNCLFSKYFYGSSFLPFAFAAVGDCCCFTPSVCANYSFCLTDKWDWSSHDFDLYSPMTNDEHIFRCLSSIFCFKKVYINTTNHFEFLYYWVLRVFHKLFIFSLHKTLIYKYFLKNLWADLREGVLFCSVLFLPCDLRIQSIMGGWGRWGGIQGTQEDRKQC